MAEPNNRCRLYLITPPAFEPDAFRDQLVKALSGGDVACLQVRMKDVADDVIRRAVDVIAPLTSSADVALVMNDRPDLAKELGCDGVHIGQEDAPYEEARRVMGADAIIGVTCHDSRHLAMEAAESGADYVAFGAFFPTSTKEAKSQTDSGILTWWQELMEPPCVAIGGITVSNAAGLVAAGADFLAVSSGVWNDPDGPEQAVRRFNALFEESAG